MMVYANQEYDPEDPWDGLFKGQLLVCVSASVSFSSIANFMFTGVQARVYFAQFSGERGESDPIGKCSHTWHDQCHDRIYRIHCHAGTPVTGGNATTCTDYLRVSFASPCHRRRSSAGRIPQQILHDSMEVYWISWTTLMRKMT
jgi:hypothetical protein